MCNSAGEGLEDAGLAAAGLAGFIEGLALGQLGGDLGFGGDLSLGDDPFAAGLLLLAGLQHPRPVAGLQAIEVGAELPTFTGLLAWVLPMEAIEDTLLIGTGAGCRSVAAGGDALHLGRVRFCSGDATGLPVGDSFFDSIKGIAHGEEAISLNSSNTDRTNDQAHDRVRCERDGTLGLASAGPFSLVDPMSKLDTWENWDSWAEPDDPAEPGWYATLVCWESNEGVCALVFQWDGEGWDVNTRPMAWHGPFATREEAQDWASDHDPDL